jgi:protein-L-isoaspartate O-methyltransferase
VTDVVASHAAKSTADWPLYAGRLAQAVTEQEPRWQEVIAQTPRHLLVPHWFSRIGPPLGGGWKLRHGPADERAWIRAAYSDQTLITRIGPLHADRAQPDDKPAGDLTSSSTYPSLVMRMLRHLRVEDGNTVLDVATGSGYSCALLCNRVGQDRVTSIDMDPYLVQAATGRLDSMGLHPQVVCCDATGDLPGEHDRLVSMVSARPFPAGWLTALRTGGRLVAVIAGTSLIVVAEKMADGTARGRLARDIAMFMPTRSGQDYPTGLRERLQELNDREGDEVTDSAYPVADGAWQVQSMLELVAPGIEHHFAMEPGGKRTLYLLHKDGSWARATAQFMDSPVVHQGGPRRLWDIFVEVRHHWLASGVFPLHEAEVTITPDETQLRHGQRVITLNG